MSMFYFSSSMWIFLVVVWCVCCVPSLVSSSSLADPPKSAPSSDFIHSKTVHVEMTATKYWEFNHRTEHIDGMKVEMIDAPIQGCPSQDFHVACTVGGQSFMCQVDTGSTSLGIATTACTACSGVKTFYNPSAATLLSTGDLKSTFGSGASWTGNGYRDSVAVAGSTSTSLVFVGITSQNAFFQAYDECNLVQSALKYSAIMGFAGPSIGVSNGNGVQAQPWFRQYVASTGVPALFTLRMCLDNGDLWLGGYNTSTFTDQLHWVNIQQLGQFSPGSAFYTIALECIGVIGGGNDCNTGDFQNGVNSIVDSGTTNAIIPAAVYNNILTQLNTLSSQFTAWFGNAAPTASAFFAAQSCFPASGNTNIAAMNAILPKVTVQIGGADSGISLVMTLNGVNFYLMQVISNGKPFFCPGIQNNANSVGTGTVILGWSFMNQFIVAHDLTTNKVGFAPRLGCADASAGGGALNNMVGGDVNVTDATGALGISATGFNAGNQGVATNKGSSSNNTAIIVGVVVGVVVLVAVIIGACAYAKRQTVQDTTMSAMQKQQPPQQQQQQWAVPAQQQQWAAPPAYQV